MSENIEERTVPVRALLDLFKQASLEQESPGRDVGRVWADTGHSGERGACVSIFPGRYKDGTYSYLSQGGVALTFCPAKDFSGDEITPETEVVVSDPELLEALNR
jgi:hypothetical protein